MSLPPVERLRAESIPFRGNPSDVDHLDVNGVKKIYVPLGGDLMTPGDEVAVYDGSGAPRHIKVGIRPQRLAVDEDNDLVFVCNQYSNYISVIDARTDTLVAVPIFAGMSNIVTEFYCSDIVLLPLTPGSTERALFVANEWRGSVLRHDLTIHRSANTDSSVEIVVNCGGSPCWGVEVTAEIFGVGKNPRRLSIAEDKSSLFVYNSRGGEIALVNTVDNSVSRRVVLDAPAIDGAQMAQNVFVLTTTGDRGSPSFTEQDLLPDVLRATPLEIVGIDNQQHAVTPGAQFDNTLSYGLEDVRSGIYSLGANLPQQNLPDAVYVDDNDPNVNYAAGQKLLAGALPQAVIRNTAGTRLYVALGGSDMVQEIEVIPGGQFRLRRIADAIFETSARPFALSLDEVEGRLYVVTWGGEFLEIFDLTTRQLVDGGRIDLGYATPAYPASLIEAGEYLFYNADWTNDGRKSCANCHLDELLTDGFSFSIGTTAPTASHKVMPTFNQFASGNFYWNGSFANGSTRSLEFAAQTRTNCELVLFGLVEGITSDPATRVGDPANRVRGNDTICRPVFANSGDTTPVNIGAIQAEIAQQQAVADQLIREATLNRIGVSLSRSEVSRFIDIYVLSELPPGHALLRDGERGYATKRNENPFNVHGVTSELSKDEYDALSWYLEIIP